MGGRGGGGCAVVPRYRPLVPRPGPPASTGGWSVAPGPGPISWPAAWHRASLPAACSARAVAQHRAPAVVQPASVWSVMLGGVWRRCAAPRLGLGRGAGVRSASVCLPAPPRRASRRAAPSLPFAPHCTGSLPRAAAQMRSGAGLLACGGYCGNGRAAYWGHASYGSVYRSSFTPDWVLRPSRGGVVPLARGGGAAGPPSPWPASCCPRAGGGVGWGQKGGGLPAVPLRSPGAALWWLRGGGLTGLGPGGRAVDEGGGAHSPPAPLALTGC